MCFVEKFKNYIKYSKVPYTFIMNNHIINNNNDIFSLKKYLFAISYYFINTLKFTFTNGKNSN